MTIAHKMAFLEGRRLDAFGWEIAGIQRHIDYCVATGSEVPVGRFLPWHNVVYGESDAGVKSGKADADGGLARKMLAMVQKPDAENNDSKP